ncbi:AAA family ATPase [Blastococcus mobilis]|uniref:AAA family ATPase n=1 Tax=Blastococcus mobilis TaxID=1938746 RepID=UPI0015956447|nr:AAA family ATPase [Blastococcus mobilis]
MSTADDMWAGWDEAAPDAEVTYIHHARSAQAGEPRRQQRDPLDVDQAVAEAVVRLKAAELARQQLAAERGDADFERMVADEAQRLRARKDAAELVAAERAATAEEAGLEGLDLSPAVSGAEFVFGTDAELEPIWGTSEMTLWAAGEAMMIHGPQGLGKTTLAHQLVKGLLGLQDDLLGFPVAPTTGRVLYLAMDRPRQAARALRRQFEQATQAERAVLDERLEVWKGPLPAPLLTRPGLLRDLAKRFGASVVIVDSLKDAVAKLSDDEHGSNYNQAIQMCLVAGIQVCDLHHPRKSNAETAGKPKGVDDIFGSTWLTAGHGSIVNLHGKTGDLVVELSMLKLVNDDPGTLQVVHDHEAGVSTVQGAFDHLVALAAAGSLTAQQAANAEHGSSSASNVQKARRKLDKLVEKGWATVVEGKRGGAATTWTVTEDGKRVASGSKRSAAHQQREERLQAGGFGTGGVQAGRWSNDDPF